MGKYILDTDRVDDVKNYFDENNINADVHTIISDLFDEWILEFED